MASHRSIGLCAALLASALLARRAGAGDLTFHLEYELYHDGDTMNLQVGLNRAMPAADVYLVLVFPNGGVVSVVESVESPGTVAVLEGYHPIGTEIVLQPFAPVPAFSYFFTGQEPSGDYRWNVLFIRPGGDPASPSDRILAEGIGFDVQGDPPPGIGPFAVSHVDEDIRCLGVNAYTRPRHAYGPPDAVFLGQLDQFEGIVSLGLDGWVIWTMGVEILDGPGDDVRIWQTVAMERLEVRVASDPGGPFVSLGNQRCGRKASYFSSYCDFDLAPAGVDRARYVYVLDRSLIDTPDAECDATAGADIDAVEAIHF
ncbi:MAG TPA: hypothetical protein VGB99_12135 [Acidobacteriota bacterium]